MKRRYRPQDFGALLGGASTLVVETRSGERWFELSLGGQRLGVSEKPSELAALRLNAKDQEALFDVFFREVPAALERRGALVVLGDRAALTALLGAFSPPPAAGLDASGGGRGKAVLGRA